MSFSGSSERGYIIADTVMVMSLTKIRDNAESLTKEGKRKAHASLDPLNEVSGNGSAIRCNSCFDLFRLSYTLACQHAYCKGCLRKMFLCALKDRTMPVKCCGKRIDQRLRRDVLTLEELSEFEDALEEIEAPNKMYCPNKKCATFYNLAKVWADGDSSFSCKQCNQRLCARCRTSHPTLSCLQFQSLPADQRNMEDIALFDVAKRSYYARCNHCQSFVEKIDGCSHMLCRCGHDFCYEQQRYRGPAAPLFPAVLQAGSNFLFTTSASFEVEDSAYALEEAPCTHEWRGCNRVLDRPRLCHLCHQTKRCFQSYCTKCRLRACAICLKSELAVRIVQ